MRIAPEERTVRRQQYLFENLLETLASLGPIATHAMDQENLIELAADPPSGV